MGFVSGEYLFGGQPQQRRVSLQVPLGIDRRADAFVIFGLQRVDDPAVEMQLVRRFLQAQSPTLALGFEPRSDRCDDIGHRSMPERIICAWSESGNSVCTRRASAAA